MSVGDTSDFLFCFMLCLREYIFFFFFKQKTAYEIYQCDWSSDVCSSDLRRVILLIVGVLVALLTAMTGVVAFGAWQHWTVARQHQIANEYSARLLNAAGMLAVERGLTYIALERPRPITAAERRRLDKTRIETDRAWEQALAVRTRTLRSLNRANDAIGPLDAKLGKFRQAADRALARPKGERSPGIATHWFSFVTGIIDEI